MPNYRIIRPDNRPTNNSIDGFSSSTYQARPTIVGRSEQVVTTASSITPAHSASPAALVQQEIAKPALIRENLVSDASSSAMSIMGLDQTSAPPVSVPQDAKPFGLAPALEVKKEIVQTPVEATTVELGTSNKPKVKSRRIRSTVSSALRFVKPLASRPKIRDWEEFKIFTAGATLAAGMIVLGFYLGFNRPLTYAESQNNDTNTSQSSETAVDQSEAAAVIKTTDDGQKVEVSEGVNPNNVDRRPPAPVTPNLPVRMRIPFIGVNAPIRSVGLLADKSLAVPNLLNQVGWYDQSAHPGEPGTVLMDGHYDPNMTNVVFRRLHEVQVGTEIEVVRGDGQVITYSVENKVSYDKNAVPMDKVFARDDKERLSIVTCDGKWLNNEKTFSNRLVVYAVRR